MSSPVILAFRYRDAPRALAWLCEAFGFRRHLVIEGDDGRIEHAQLTFGPGMIMLGRVREDDYDELVGTVPEGGRPTASVCVVVDDVDAHAERARKAGAEIVEEPNDRPYGGRLYLCRDFEGNIWGFGSYDPWVETE